MSIETRLEDLFGSVDFCACEHCRSVLSPAAYLVGLFEFLELGADPAVGRNPIDVLFERRPDLPHLLLSCENTNVALPYVDLVNEILEFWVVNDGLAGFTGHDTRPGERTEDLLVDPAFIEAEAYPPLTAQVFPAPLPFDMPLESMRLQFQAWDTSLAALLGRFGTAAAARRERLGLNAAEWSILTDVGFRAVPEYLGEGPGTSMAALDAAVPTARDFCRRVGLTYTELTETLQASFVNPGRPLVPDLTELGLGMASIADWFGGDLTDAALVAELPPGFDATPFDGDVLAWLTERRPLLESLITLTPTDDADPEVDDCDFSKLRLRTELRQPNHLAELDLLRVLRFTRIWRLLDRQVKSSIADADRLLASFLPTPPAELTLANIDQACATALDRIANVLFLLDEVGANASTLPLWWALFTSDTDPVLRAAHLATLLDLGTGDYDSLVAITGIDPVAADDLGTAEPSLMRFVRARRTLSRAGLKVTDLEYVLRDIDASQLRAPSAESLQAELGAVRQALAAVDGTVGSASDLAGLESQLALVHAPEVVREFLDLLGGRATITVDLPGPVTALPDPVAALGTTLGFDAFGRQLSFAGVMTASEEAALHAAVAGLVLDDIDEITQQPDLDAYIAQLTAAITALRTAGDARVAALEADEAALGLALRDALVEPDPTDAIAVVLARLLRPLSLSLKRVAVQRILATLLRIDERMARVLTERAAVLHTDADAGAAVIDDFLALEGDVMFDVNDTIEFLVVPATTDDHHLHVGAPEGTSVRLVVDGDVVVPTTVVGPDGEVATAAPVQLTAGRPVLMALTLAGLPAGQAATVSWRTRGMGRRLIPTPQLVPAAAAAATTRSLRRLHKASELVGVLRLTPREVDHLAGDAPDTAGFLRELPVDGPPAAAALPAAWGPLARLLWFPAFKTDTEPDT
ncbi:MAG: Tc toxin subunit A, partial [Actinomycetota bacterium]|nr:Tc toxin subunit A [Actinomycetota bacterium]